MDQLEYTQRAAVDYVLPVYTIYKDDKTIPFDERWDKKIESYYINWKFEKYVNFKALIWLGSKSIGIYLEKII